MTILITNHAIRRCGAIDERHRSMKLCVQCDITDLTVRLADLISTMYHGLCLSSLYNLKPNVRNLTICDDN